MQLEHSKSGSAGQSVEAKKLEVVTWSGAIATVALAISGAIAATEILMPLAALGAAFSVFGARRLQKQHLREARDESVSQTLGSSAH